MFFNRRIRSIFCILLAFLIIGTSNHCAFEDLFVTISNSIFGGTKPGHLSNHVGATSSHKHEDSSQSHEHGEPHQLVVVKAEKTGTELAKILLIIIPFSPFLIRARLQSNRFKLQIKIFLRFLSDTREQLKDFISSLTLAPQAPPFRA